MFPHLDREFFRLAGLPGEAREAREARILLRRSLRFINSLPVSAMPPAGIDGIASTIFNL